MDPRARQRGALLQARQRTRVTRDLRLGVRPAREAAVEDLDAGGGAAQRPGDAHEVADDGAVAAGERARGPPDDRHRDEPDRRGDDVASGDGHPRGGGECVGAAHQLERRRGIEAAADAQRDVGLAGVGAHRREVGERACERPVAGIGGGHPVEAEMLVLDHRVGRDDGALPAHPYDRGVIADRALDAVAPRARDRGDRLDQGALVQWTQRWR